MATVLFVVTGARSWTLADGSSVPTGYWAEELVAPFEVLADAGHPLPHGLGHGTGLDIHEDPFLRADDEVLAAGTVVTVEPGVYIPGLGGVRIEDMVEVTADGPRGIPRTSKELLLL